MPVLPDPLAPAADASDPGAPHPVPAAAPPGAPAELQQALDDCQQRLQHIQRDQAAMAHGLSHDLRAPLRAIKGYASVLGNAPGLDATMAEHVQRIDAAATHMATLLDALLDLSRVERTALRLQQVDVSLLAEWAGADVVNAHPGVDTDLQVQEGLHAWVDESLLKQALEHLLHNAVRFSSHDPPVRIRVNGEVDGERLLLHVRDAGRGFDMRYADRMMEPFQRLHASAAGAGAGLGLAIVARIVQRLNGTVQAHSDGEGQGSRFTLALPLQEAGR